MKTAHASFHKEAAHVLELGLAGKKPEAEAALGFKGKFVELSAALTSEMMAWKREAT